MHDVIQPTKKRIMLFYLINYLIKIQLTLERRHPKPLEKQVLDRLHRDPKK